MFRVVGVTYPSMQRGKKQIGQTISGLCRRNSGLEVDCVVLAETPTMSQGPFRLDPPTPPTPKHLAFVFSGNVYHQDLLYFAYHPRIRYSNSKVIETVLVAPSVADSKNRLRPFRGKRI